MSDSRRAIPIERLSAAITRRGVSGLALPGEAFQHVLLIVGFIIALRLPYFGNPAIYIDEQFYLFVADRWLHEGLLPYVDIWDRKPIGIFLIYVLAENFRDPVIGYQILALMCAAATALLVWATTALVWPRTVGLYAAMFYGVTLMLMDGQGGQTPVYYNLPVMAAAYLLLRLTVQPQAPGAARAALTAGLLFGIALQIKYSVVFEATTLSLIGLVALFVRHGWRLGRLMTLALGMAALGLAPTAMAGAAYAAIGHWHDFFFANFLSILQKDSWRMPSRIYVREYLRSTLRSSHLLFLTAFVGSDILRSRARLTTPERWMLLSLGIWLAATYAGALILGKPAQHYFLPTVLPLSILAALGLERLFANRGVAHFLPRWPGRFDATVVFAAIIGLTTVASFYIVQYTEVHWGAPPLIMRSSVAVKELLGRRCLYVFNRLPIYYYLTDSCVPTRYAFPNHLNDASELHALPDDGLTEFARVLATKPVLLVRIPITQETSPEAEEMLNRALVRDYTLERVFEGDRQTINVYVPRTSEGVPPEPSSR